MKVSRAEVEAKGTETLRLALASPVGSVVRIELNGAKDWVEVDLTRDGASSWLLKVTGERGQVYFDCGGNGVANLTPESLVTIIMKSFNVGAKAAPS